MNSFFFCTVRDWNYLPEETVPTCIHSWILQELHLTINYLRGTPPALVKGSRATSTRSHGTCTMFPVYPCTLHCRHANPRSWSGVFNLLKFDLTPKKKKRIDHVSVQRGLPKNIFSGGIYPLAASASIYTLETGYFFSFPLCYWSYTCQEIMTVTKDTYSQIY